MDQHRLDLRLQPGWCQCIAVDITNPGQAVGGTGAAAPALELGTLTQTAVTKNVDAMMKECIGVR